MRTFGLVLLVASIAGYFYCADRLSQLPPEPDNDAPTLVETLRSPEGRMELGRYASAGVGVIGVLFLILPRRV